MHVRLLIDQDLPQSQIDMKTFLPGRIKRVKGFATVDARGDKLAVHLTTSSQHQGKFLFIRGVRPDGWFTCQIERDTGIAQFSTEGRIHHQAAFLDMEVETEAPVV